MVRTLGALVRLESPSFDKPAVDRCGAKVAAEWQRRGAHVEVLPQKQRGNHLRVTLWPGRRRTTGQFLILGHLDTVYDLGALQRMPFRIANGRAWGPGTLDMKAGIVQALYAAEALERLHRPPGKRVVCLWTSDEEIGSDASRRVIEREALRSDAVFVLEPAYGLNGALKTSRKGVGQLEIEITGRAAHAGLAPEQGVNAVHELAMQVSRIAGFTDLSRGITVNAGIIEGGTRTNVIADRARAVIDLRAARITDMKRLERKLQALKPILRGARLKLTGGFNRPPLERRMSAALYRKAEALAKEMGCKIAESSVGGGSDGNLTAALCVPTLDGLGAVGDGAHSPTEHVLIRAMPERAALLAALLAAP
jgi:glutamate carboxypeptidase